MKQLAPASERGPDDQVASIIQPLPNLGVTPLLASRAPVAIVTPSTAAAAISTKPKPVLGIATGDTLPWLSSGELAHELDDLATLGATWIRMDFSWKNIQPDSVQSFNWAPYDRVVQASSQRHLQVLGVIAYTPAWARPGNCRSQESCAPADKAQFAAFSAALATHYKDTVSNWEIWNEPNLYGFWKPAPNAAAYTDLLKATYSAVKQANPATLVLTGGLGSSDGNGGTIEQREFLKGIYAAGGKNSFDGVAYHPYSFPAMPGTALSWNGWSKITALPSNLRGIMIDQGDEQKPLWLTEYGAPTNGPGALATSSGYDASAGQYFTSEELQAAMAGEAVELNEDYTWSGPLFWYSYKDLGTTTNTMENFFGMYRHDGTKKPVYDALVRAIAN